MKIIPVTCSQCGGNITIETFTTRLACPYCGTAFIVDCRESKKTGKNFPTEDNPIEVQIEQINSTLVKLEGRDSVFELGMDQEAITKGINIISALSYFSNREYEIITTTSCVGTVEYRVWGHDGIDTKESRYSTLIEYGKVVHSINKTKKTLISYGFEVSELWNKSDRIKVKLLRNPLDIALGVKDKYRKVECRDCCIQATKKITPSSWNSIMNNHFKDRVNQLFQNDAIIQISNSIISELQNCQNEYMTQGDEGSHSIRIIVREDEVICPGANCIFHNMGMDNISDSITMQAFVCNLINSILKQCVEDNKPIWILNEIKLLYNSIELNLLHTKIYTKVYRSW
ncbi:MAG: hypothetical protein E7265_08450 [Lachnospiraceae bacterium]|nr:hypothetical protein [Lachnospiraceae bacterium]